VKARLVVLISGGGTNLEALLADLPASGIEAEVVAVGADNEAPGLAHATKRNMDTFVCPVANYPSRDAWGVALGDLIATYRPEWIVLSGFMKLLPPNVVTRFAGRIINTHPAFLPEFPGAHGVRDALAAGVNQTGASVIVVDDGIDTGEILAQQRVAILENDTQEVLHERIKVMERKLLLDVVATLSARPKTIERT